MNGLENIAKQPVFTDFERNRQIQGIEYDADKLAAQKVLILGANPTSENIVKQLLGIGFKEVYMWSPERNSAGTAKAEIILSELNHISPYYRHKTGSASLKSHAITASFDELGFSLSSLVEPSIVINTENNSVLSDIMLLKFFRSNQVGGMYVDAHTIMDHSQMLYGLNIQTALSASMGTPFYSQAEYLENRNLSLFDHKEHDPLMAIITASYVSAIATRYSLDMPSRANYFKKPTSFTLFPFNNNGPLNVGPSNKPVHYHGFFGDHLIYIAGLGGGSVTFDTLVNIFDVNRIRGVDKAKLKRSNFNRLIPLIDEDLLGKPKAQAIMQKYNDFISQPGKDIQLIEGVIYDSLLIGKEENEIDIIMGCLSGFDNKLNLVALSQKLSQNKRHILVDTGTEPFRLDITNYLTGVTPCDHCRNLHDLAVVGYLSENLPNCDRYPVGSTVFSGYLDALAIIEAMKFIDPELGKIATGTITTDLYPGLHDPKHLYNVRQSLYSPGCSSHWRTEPLTIKPSDYIINESTVQGWNAKEIFENDNGKPGRKIGLFRYIPKYQGGSD